mgnify:CR=1 FL=1
MGRVIQGFLPTPPPNVTHNDLTIRYRTKMSGGRVPYVAKSDRLRKAEDAIRPHIARLAPSMPLSGALMVTWKLVWPTDGKHYQGEAKTTKPDADNVVKTLNDLLETCRVIVNDAMICDMRVMKMFRDPAGIWLRVEEVDE